MSLGPLYVFLGEVSVQVLCPFFNWVVCLPGVDSCEFFICVGDQTLLKADVLTAHHSQWSNFSELIEINNLESLKD